MSWLHSKIGEMASIEKYLECFFNDDAKNPVPQ